MSVRWITGDVFDGLATLEDGSVDLVVTSPRANPHQVNAIRPTSITRERKSWLPGNPRSSRLTSRRERVMAGEIHVEVFVNDLGEKRYSPVLPDGRRPVLGGLGGTVWISDRSTVSSRRMYRWRWTALWAARREWRFHRRSNWRPKAPYEWVDLNCEVFLYDGELATRCVSHGGSLFSGDSGVCEAVEGGLAPWMDEEFLAECEAETVWVMPATPVTVNSRVSRNTDYATNNRAAVR